MSVSWLFCFTFLLLKRTVLGQGVTVEGILGKTVLLPCSLEQKPNNVFWRYRDNGKVCDIPGVEAKCIDQDPAYKGRVTISESEILKWNFSISLSNVSKSDEGLYTCIAPSRGYTSKIDLKVKEETKSPTSRNASNNGESRIRLSAFLQGCALLYNLVF